MPDIHTRVGGSWKKANKLHVRVGGAWKEIKNGYVRVGSAWKKFFQNLIVILTDRSVADIGAFPVPSLAGIRLEANGALFLRRKDNFVEILGEWADPATPGLGPGFDVRFTNTGAGSRGTVDTGTLGLWQSLSVAREWTIERSNIGGPDTFVGLLEIRDTSQVLLASATITLSVMVES